MAAQETAAPATIVTFWQDAGPKRWFEPDAAFDAEIRTRFLVTHEAAAAGALSEWEMTPQGTLALLLLLDQFPRNMFRGTARAFATDGQARAVARRGLERGFDAQVSRDLRTFFYLPFMHSEELADQERCLALYQALGDEEGVEYAELHLDAIRRFGRFPHRNEILGRKARPEEIAYLESGGFNG